MGLSCMLALQKCCKGPVKGMIIRARVDSHNRAFWEVEIKQSKKASNF